MDVAHAEQGADVGVVRLSGERVDEKERGVDAAGGGERGDLGVATLRPRQQLFDLEAHLVAHEPGRVMRGDEGEAGERVAVVRRPGDEVHLLVVVCDEGQSPHS